MKRPPGISDFQHLSIGEDDHNHDEENGGMGKCFIA